MTTVLHIITRSQDALASDLIERQRAAAACRVEVVDLTTPDPDYTALLHRIFEADSVAVW